MIVTIVTDTARTPVPIIISRDAVVKPVYGAKVVVVVVFVLLLIGLLTGNSLKVATAMLEIKPTA
jgi:hypothetical protein